MPRPPVPAPQVLREYTLLADGERGAIIGPRGDIGWLCAPKWDSGSVFSSLVGGQGSYQVAPEGPFVWGGYYEGASLIWRNRWITTFGVVECRDVLAFPGDPHRLVLLRRVHAVDHDASISVLLRPRGDYDTTSMSDGRQADAVWTARVGGLYLRWTAPIRFRPSAHGEEIRARLELAAGEERDLVLEISDQPLTDQPVDPDMTWRTTESGWKRAIPELTTVLSPADTAHSVAVLRGLTSSGGGMVAAATTSLPESFEAGRNYDYRYVWIRDQCYAGQAAAACGIDSLLDDAVRFVSDRLLADGERLVPAYTSDGTSVPSQQHLDLPGYPGGYDIVGNWVNQQFQLDAFGESLLLLAAAARLDRLDGQHWDAAAVAADAIGSRWQEPDAGIWEIDDRPWTHSRLIAAAGLREIAAVSPAERRATEWMALADHIVAHTAANALTDEGRWQRSPDDPRLDGALLWVGIRGVVPIDDPRTRATLDGYLHELTVDGYAYRFRQDERPLGDAEGSFLLCGFLTALALHLDGRDLDARAWYERTRAARGPAQLFSEEYDGQQNQMRGNLPQAFVHALFVETSAQLGRDA